MTFKTAAQLKITPEEHRALQLALDYMESGKVEHIAKPRRWYWRDERRHGTPEPRLRYFNMAFWNVECHDCGTVACIGGIAETLGGVSFSVAGLPSALDDLFYPRVVEKNTEEISLDEAAVALRGYLETGRTSWSHLS